MPRPSRFQQAVDRKRWAGIRLKVLNRDGYRCRQCGRAGRLEVDHRVPLHRGGAVYDLANLQSLCRTCHVAKSRRERKRPPTAWDRLVAELL